MQPSSNLQRLDEVIARLQGGDGRGGPELLLEHLRAARRNHLGSAPKEYALNLEQAMGAANSLPSKSMKDSVKGTLQSLVAEAADARRLPSPPPR